MIITLAFANGFQQKVSEKVFSFWGHIRLQEIQPYQSVITEELPITANDSLITAIKNIPEVETIHPFATRYAILKTKDDLEGVLVKGHDSITTSIISKILSSKGIRRYLTTAATAGR